MAEFAFGLYNYDFAMARLMGDIRNGLVEQDELLGKIKSELVSHGGVTRQVSGPEIVETEMVETRAMFEISIDAFRQTDARQFTESVFNLFDSFHHEQKKKLLEMVSQTTEAVGNVVDAKGKNFWDAYLEMIQITQMTFDAEGNHNYQIVLNPKTARKLEENPPTEEQSRRIKEAIELKRREYYERKPSRKLS